jgi:DNA polymerase I-like protein with 3'-5' exonuclease and polymerase domains
MATELTFTTTDSDWTPPTSYPDLSDRSMIAIDLETRDPNIKKTGPGWPTNDGEIVGIAVATDGFKGYFPIAHERGDNLDPAMTMKWFQKVMASDADKICHNASYDIGWCRASGIKTNGRIIDTMLAGAIIDENRRGYSLNALSAEYLGEIKSEVKLREKAEEWGLDAKADLWKLPPSFVGEYAEQDAELTLKLWRKFETEIRLQNLSSIFEMETKLLPILI